MKLYTLKQGDRFKLIDKSTGTYVKGSDGEDAVLIFNKVDGMYAQCFYHSNLEYIAAYLEVDKLEYVK